jgi:S1-C subfamily serine protease
MTGEYEGPPEECAMTRIEIIARGSIAIVALIALLASPVVLAGDEDHERVVITSKTDGKVKVVTVDDEGNRHEEVFEFDGDNPRAFLGVGLEDTPDGGALIDSVVEDSGAAKAGLREGDIIVGIDGGDVEGPWDLTRAVLEAQPGDLVELAVVRDGEPMSVTAELGQRKGFAEIYRMGEHLEGLEEHLENLDEHMKALDIWVDKDGEHPRIKVMRRHRPKLGVQLVQTTPELREHLGSDGETGVLVGKVMPGMPAEDGGIQVGDLIVAVDGASIGGTSDLRRALTEKDGQTIEVEVIRDGRNRRFDVVIPLEDEED